MVGLKLNTPNGEGELRKIYLSELGYLMMKVENDNKTFTTYNLGKPKDGLSIDDFIIYLTKNNDWEAQQNLQDDF